MLTQVTHIVTQTTAMMPNEARNSLSGLNLCEIASETRTPCSGDQVADASNRILPAVSGNLNHNNEYVDVCGQERTQAPVSAVTHDVPQNSKQNNCDLQRAECGEDKSILPHLTTDACARVRTPRAADPLLTLVVIESPYAGDVAANVAFCEAVCRYACLQGYAPLASHLFYTRFLDDAIPAERRHGIDAGLAWGKHAEEAWFCLRPGDVMSGGMHYALDRHVKEGRLLRFKRFTQDGTFVTDETVAL